jgi:hypothetical protein
MRKMIPVKILPMDERGESLEVVVGWAMLVSIMWVFIKILQSFSWSSLDRFSLSWFQEVFL